jgi:hypothetical protein
MNERLKELYTQVCMEQKLPFTVEHNSAVMLDTFANKFAKVIIRECALTAGLMEHEGRKGIGAQILDNFGVEL